MRKLLEKYHPNLIDEIHPTKNNKLNLDALYENSSKKIWWQCKINSKHEWQQSANGRSLKGYGCPYCSGRKTMPADSFATLFPQIALELHPVKNTNFNPYKVSPNSNKKVWWLCSNGHEWNVAIFQRVRQKSGCRLCNIAKNTLSVKYPHIARELHPTKNNGLSAETLSSNSKQKVWWICSNDNSHEWKAVVYSRTLAKAGCPQCAKSVMPYSYPTLAEHSHVLAKQWHPTKNGKLKPSDITAGSSRDVWWICPENSSHEWKSQIRNRAIRGSGCPFCKKMRPDTRESLASKYPNIAKLWHPLRNNDLKPSDVSYGSQITVWWQCTKNAKHEWQASITSRTQQNNNKCPFCTGRRLTPSNSLQTVYPKISTEWHPTKNGDINPSLISKASGKKVWWQCSVNPEHVWEAQVKNRTILGSGCPTCSHERHIVRVQNYLYETAYDFTDYYKTFISNLHNIQRLIDFQIADKKSLRQPFFRMLYSSAITAVETYLSDAFYQSVIDDNIRLEKLLKSVPDFSTKKYTIDEVLAWQQHRNKKITEYLFEISWHNIAKVQNMYKSVLGLEFPDELSDIYKAVAIRHDIVHRSGRTKAGSAHKFEKDQLLQLLKDIRTFISYIDKQVRELKTEPDAAHEQVPQDAF